MPRFADEPTSPLREEIAAKIRDAYYHARDHGGTMHTGSYDAADALLAPDGPLAVDTKDRFPSARLACPRCGTGFTVTKPGDYVVKCGATVRVVPYETTLLHVANGTHGNG